MILKFPRRNTSWNMGKACKTCVLGWWNVFRPIFEIEGVRINSSHGDILVEREKWNLVRWSKMLRDEIHEVKRGWQRWWHVPKHTCAKPCFASNLGNNWWKWMKPKMIYLRINCYISISSRKPHEKAWKWPKPVFLCSKTHVHTCAKHGFRPKTRYNNSKLKR